MAGVPFISIRKYIKWGDDEASENTDTLVLTTAGKHYVDIRIFLPENPSSPSIPTSPLLPISRLEWGFAGTALSTPSSDTKPAHTIWTHWVDSKSIEEVRDEGDMHPQPNGEVLEYGEMVNPMKDKVEKYEECWVDLEPRVVGDEGVKRSWVIRTEGKEGGEFVRGVVVRVAGFIQGVLRRESGVSVSRWVWSKGRGWEKAVTIGQLHTPVAVFEVGREMKQGDKLEGGDGLIWECVEAFEWS